MGHYNDSYIGISVLDVFDGGTQSSGIGAEFMRIVGVIGRDAFQIIPAIVDDGNHVQLTVINVF